MEEFTDLVGDLDYPMMIVTAASGGERAGCLVGFATQCSIDPPRFAVWISRKNHTFRIAGDAGVLAVHFVSAADRALAELFGGATGDEGDKFTRCRWRDGPSGVPVLEDCVRWFAGEVIERFPTEDHVGFLLAPISVSSGAWAGQLGFQAARSISPGHEA
ncbi:MAG TPA: flavin reductase family protein [Acidimicrobiales bacterium]|nr:flavin reductase family protein [Acidimicrobiales bacterium]